MIVAAFASATRMRSGNVSCEPPSAITLADARNDRPLPPRKMPDRDSSDRCRRSRCARPAVDRSTSPNVSAPGRSTVSRTTMTLIGMAGEHLARVAHAVDAVGDARDGRIEIELAPVVGDRRLRDRS